MGFFNKLFGSGENETKKESTADRMVQVIKKKTTIDCVKLIPEEGKTQYWNSKIGGIPYLPIDFEYPYDKTEGREEIPLRFLAQLNFSEMPHLEGFPKEGIVQFYISDQDVYGMNFEELTTQKGFRVIYHEKISEDAALLQVEVPVTAMEGEKVDFPVEEELKLRFEKTSMAMGGGDYRFDKLLLEAYNELYPGEKVASLDRIPEDDLDGVYENLDTEGHRVGGYPMFTQLDPREYHEDLKGHTVLLFQLDTDETDSYSILWGDSGVGNFFIRPEDLAKRDFSNVLYNWDCY